MTSPRPISARCARSGPLARPMPGLPRARGIALPAMVFLLVILGLMLAGGLALVAQSQQGQSLMLQSTRALAAAKSGAEWGLWQVSDSDGSLGLAADQAPPCFATRTLAFPAPLADVPVQVSCTREPATGTVDEGGLRLASYRIQAVVSVGATAGVDHVRRTFEARHTVCKNPGGTAPTYSC